MQGKINIGGITLIYDIAENSRELTITGFEGSDSRITVPEYLMPDNEAYVLTSVGKKAFLGAKFLKEISLPATVTNLGDWAFASCNHLEKLVIRGNDNVSESMTRLTFGRGAFEGCESLENILLGYEENDDLSVLLGAAIWRLPAPYLLKDPDIGKESWYLSFDRSLDNYLNERDDEGYTDRVLCGEEDISYDGIGSVDGELLSDGTNFIIETRKRKCHLCFLRLMAPRNLTGEYRHRFEQYLINHGKALHGAIGKSEEAWLVLKDELKGRIEYLKMYADIGGIKAELVDDMLTDLGEDYAEGKAFLIKYKQDNTSGNDFFANLLI